MRNTGDPLEALVTAIQTRSAALRIEAIRAHQSENPALKAIAPIVEFMAGEWGALAGEISRAAPDMLLPQSVVRLALAQAANSAMTHANQEAQGSAADVALAAVGNHLQQAAAAIQEAYQEGQLPNPFWDPAAAHIADAEVSDDDSPHPPGG